MASQDISNTPKSKCRNENYTADSLKTTFEAILEACISDQMSITTYHKN